MTHQSVEVGRITPNGKVHLTSRGRSFCPTVAHRRISRPVSRTDLAVKVLCKHCFTDEHIATAQGDVVNASTLDTRIDAILRNIVEARRTPDEKARLDALADQVRATMLAALAPAPRSWADLRADFAAYRTRNAEPALFAA